VKVSRDLPGAGANDFVQNSAVTAPRASCATRCKGCGGGEWGDPARELTKADRPSNLESSEVDHAFDGVSEAFVRRMAGAQV
jgi:hypothetical protein